MAIYMTLILLSIIAEAIQDPKKIDSFSVQYKNSVSVTPADVTEEIPYFDRVKNAAVGFIIGSILLFFSIMLLWIVEKKAVDYDFLLSRCKRAVQSVSDCEYVNRAFEEFPVFVSGSTITNHQLRTCSDTDTGFSYQGIQNCIRLKRTVEMFQWVEIKKQEEKKTVYTYEQKWSETDFNSSFFRDKSARYHNPARNPSLFSEIRDSNTVYVGKYLLSSELICKLHKWELCELKKENLLTSGVKVESATKLHTRISQLNFENILQEHSEQASDYYVYNGSISSPSIGTVRISYEVVLDGGDVSLIGVQNMSSFRPFTRKDAETMNPSCITSLTCFNESSSDDSTTCTSPICSFCATLANKVAGDVIGTSVLLLEERKTAVTNLFKDENILFRKRLHLTRFGGCLAISLAIYFIFNPIAVVFSFIPYLSGLISNVFFLLALILGFVIGWLVISISWISHRPEYLLGNYHGIDFISLMTNNDSNCCI
jgi:hypothetical protein